MDVGNCGRTSFQLPISIAFPTLLLEPHGPTRPVPVLVPSLTPTPQTHTAREESVAKGVEAMAADRHQLDLDLLLKSTSNLRNSTRGPR